MSPKSESKASNTTTAAGRQKNAGFTAAERAAMKERARELRAEKEKVDGASAVLSKIDEMTEPDQTLARRVHEIVTANAPDLVPRLWYGMPAYTRDGKVLCFFQAAQKFDTRYSTLGFNDGANLDDGAMWPVAFALTEITGAVEEKIAALVRQAVG